MEELSTRTSWIVARARKIQRFLSQPFFVAEQFTGSPGTGREGRRHREELSGDRRRPSTTSSRSRPSTWSATSARLSRRPRCSPEAASVADRLTLEVATRPGWVVTEDVDESLRPAARDTSVSCRATRRS